MKTTPRQSAGFTLIEIMMVVMILGLTLAMGFPVFTRALRKEGMGKLERDMVTACQNARRNSILHNQTTDLVIRPLDRTFSVPGVFDPVEIPGNIAIEALGVNFQALETADEVHVHFYPAATSDEFIIIFRAADGSYRTIYLDCVTALVRVEGGAFNPYKK